MRIDDFLTDDAAGLDFDGLFGEFAWVRAMADTPQDARYHAEGDVWTHTRLVCDALVRDEDWAAFDNAERRLLLTAALLHDAGKPEVTFTDRDGRIRSPEHAVRGESLARRILWEEEQPFVFREAVAALVRHHMQPRYVMERADPRRRAYAISQTARCDHLAMLARADTRGRIAPDRETALRQIADFVGFCADHGCLTGPRHFASEHARFLYFRNASEDPDGDVPPPAGPEITIMSGLPGAGKDSWIERERGDRAVISLDEIRTELAVSPTAPQHTVVALAHRRVRELLRGGRSFIWNATTLSRRHRRTLLDIAAPFDPAVRAVYLDAPPSLLLRRNRSRPDHAAVPDDVIRRMTCIWQPPDPTEVHSILHVIHTHDGTEVRDSALHDARHRRARQAS